MIGYVSKGSKEHVHVDLIDRTGLITELSGSGPTFDVIDSADVFKVTAGSATGSACGLRYSSTLWAVYGQKANIAYSSSSP